MHDQQGNMRKQGTPACTHVGGRQSAVALQHKVTLSIDVAKQRSCGDESGSVLSLAAMAHAGGISLEGVGEAEGPQDRGAQLPTGPGSSTAGGSKAGGGSTAAAAGRQHNQGALWLSTT